MQSISFEIQDRGESSYLVAKIDGQEADEEPLHPAFARGGLISNQALQGAFPKLILRLDGAYDLRASKEIFDMSEAAMNACYIRHFRTIGMPPVNPPWYETLGLRSA